MGSNAFLFLILIDKAKWTRLPAREALRFFFRPSESRNIFSYLVVIPFLLSRCTDRIIHFTNAFPVGKIAV